MPSWVDKVRAILGSEPTEAEVKADEATTKYTEAAERTLVAGDDVVDAAQEFANAARGAVVALRRVR